MVAEALLSLRFGRGGGGFGGGCLGFELVGEDLREEVDDAVVGDEAVGDDELVDVLGVGGGVGDDEEAAVGVAAEIDLSRWRWSRTASRSATWASMVCGAEGLVRERLRCRAGRRR